MIPTRNRIELLDACDFSNDAEREKAARLPIGDLRDLAGERQEARRELERLIDRDEYPRR